MKEQVIIIGASGHGKVVADIVQLVGDQVVGFLDDNPNLSNLFIGLPVLGSVDKFKNYTSCQFIIAIGNAAIRKRISEKMKNVQWYTAIHPSAIVSDVEVSIGEGTVVMANAVINAGTTIGKHCIINSSAVVEHDNHIEDFVHVSVGAKLAGNVRVGNNTWIGIGANVNNNLCICENCMIGAGAVVVHSIDEQGIYVGVPSRKICTKKS